MLRKGHFVDETTWLNDHSSSQYEQTTSLNDQTSCSFGAQKNHRYMEKTLVFVFNITGSYDESTSLYDKVASTYDNVLCYRLLPYVQKSCPEWV